MNGLMMRLYPTTLQFPRDKKSIAKLSLEDKLVWYQYQFEIKPIETVIEFSKPEFQRFWKWNVLVPMKFKRFFYRVKNFEIFKHYDHISKIKSKRIGKQEL